MIERSWGGMGVEFEPINCRCIVMPIEEENMSCKVCMTVPCVCQGKDWEGKDLFENEEKKSMENLGDVVVVNYGGKKFPCKLISIEKDPEGLVAFRAMVIRKKTFSSGGIVGKGEGELVLNADQLKKLESGQRKGNTLSFNFGLLMAEFTKNLKEGKMYKDINLLQACISSHVEKLNIFIESKGKAFRFNSGVYSMNNDKHLVFNDGVEIKMGEDGCALCQKYCGRGECEGCPINDNGEHEGCADTPFVNLSEVLRSSKVIDNDIIEAEKEELKFLIDTMVGLSTQVEKVIYRAGQRFKKDGVEYILMYDDIDKDNMDLVSMSTFAPVDDDAVWQDVVIVKDDFSERWGEGFEPVKEGGK